MVHRLLYASRIASIHLPSDMEDILRVSVANNSRDRITGFLVCDGASFAQALEGEQAMVRDCFSRIAADDRHTAVVLRDERDTDSRAFPRWSMCGLYLSELDDALLAGSDIHFDLHRAHPAALWQHLVSVSGRHEQELTAEHDRLLSYIES